MKSHVSSGWAAALTAEVLRAVLPGQRDARLGEHADSSGATYFVAARISTSSGRRPARCAAAATSARTRSWLARTRSGRSPRISSAMPPRPGGRSRRRRGGGRRTGRDGMSVHMATSWTFSTPAAASRSRAIALRSSVRPGGAERRAHLVADLVAARPDPGADRGGELLRPERAQRPARPPRAHRRPGPRQPAWSIATACGAISATGRQSAVSTIAPTPARVTTWPSASSTPSESTTTRAPCTWWPCASRSRPRSVRTRSRFARTAAGSSSVQRPEVQRLVRAYATRRRAAT